MLGKTFPRHTQVKKRRRKDKRDNNGLENCLLDLLKHKNY